MNLMLIRDLCEKREGGVRGLAKEIKMSEGNLHRCIRVNNIQAQALELIARILDVPVGYFFDEENGSLNISGTGHKVQNGHHNVMMEAQEKEIEHLKALLAEKERTIEILLSQKG